MQAVAPFEQKRKSQVTFDGRTIVDANALIRSEKVRNTLEKISRRKKSVMQRKGVVVLRVADNS
jgi:hypothetical protein